LEFISLSNATDISIMLINNGLIDFVRQGINLDYKQNSTNIFMFDIGNQFVSYGTQGVNGGNSFLPTASTYKLVYYGISDFYIDRCFGKYCN